MALPFKPVNLGDALTRRRVAAVQAMSPTSHWNRDMTPDFRGGDRRARPSDDVAAVFDDRVHAEDFVKAVKEADLGLSVNISTSIDGAEQCCHAACMPRHSVGYSLGFEGKTENLPNTQVLTLVHDVRARHGQHSAWRRR